MRVLLAVGSTHLANILRSHIVNAKLEVVENDVFHMNFIKESIELENPSIIILHDHYLPSDQCTKEDKEREMLKLIEYCRSSYDDAIRIVYICERERRDPFLSQLVARNVLDIFNERQISVDRFVQQLTMPPRFSNVERFGVGEIILEYSNKSSEDEVDESKDSESNEDGKEAEAELDESSTSNNTSLAENNKSENIKERFKSIPPFRSYVQYSTEVEKVKVSIDRKIIVVVSPFERSGSTFIAHQLAYQVAKQNIGVTYYENPLRRPYTYDRLGGHLIVPNFQSLYTDVDVNGVSGRERGEQKNWKVDGVSIQALNPELESPLEEEDLSVARYLRMFLSAHDTPYLIVDIGCDESREIYDEILEIASHILVVVDGDIPNLEWFEQYKLAPTFSWVHGVLKDERTVVVANRYCEGMQDVMPVEEFVGIPSFDDEWIFDSQVNGQFAFPKREAVKKQDASFSKLVKEILPKEEKTRGGRVFRGMLPKIKTESIK